MDFRKRGTRLGLSLESGEPEEQAGLPRTALWTGNKRRPSGMHTDLQSRLDSLKQEQGSLRLVSWGCSAPPPVGSPPYPIRTALCGVPGSLPQWPGSVEHWGLDLCVLGDFRGRKSKGAEASSDVAHLGNGALDFEKTIQDVD